MDITFKKDKNVLKDEVIRKSMDLEDNEYKPEIEECEVEGKFITISPQCIRCNLCAEECPVEAISEAKSNKPAKVLENCVKCEICAQTCPVKSIRVIESTSSVIDDDVKYRLQEIKVPHRSLRMKNIRLDTEKCDSCQTCVKFCPTNAIKIEDGKSIIDTDSCVGCGACVNVCPQDAVTLERELGDIIKTKKLNIAHDACVSCQVCEENCPVDAIKLEDDELVYSEDKCILCEVCSNKCPVGALKLERVSNES
ncbi:4Fe-4S binding protein [Methanobacterium sp. ACI-7]|uniref:4Fe-4S binding protein n=1 Tax=unclassified Methanobacterium TaxID=2627676 RepID=UPI0039C48367